MSGSSKIEWTEATWNPVVGCTHVSAGCDNCYAARDASGRLKHLPLYAGLAEGGRFTGEVRLVPERLDQPLRWRKPRRVFVNSMSDLFHDSVPEEFIADVFGTMLQAPRHTFQILTKRPGRMASLLRSPAFRTKVREIPESRRWSDRRGWDDSRLDEWPLRNVWLGTSVEDQHWADIRIPQLLRTPAAVRFLSCEPLLGAVDLANWTCSCDRRRWVDDENWQPEHEGERARGRIEGGGRIPCGSCNHGGWDEDDVDRPGIDWVIVGGESGPQARPMHPQWVRDLRDQCAVAGVPLFFKQWGEWRPWQEGDDPSKGFLWDGEPSKGVPWDGAGAYPLVSMIRVGKKAAGRELDGRTWDEYPQLDQVPA